MRRLPTEHIKQCNRIGNVEARKWFESLCCSFATSEFETNQRWDTDGANVMADRYWWLLIYLHVAFSRNLLQEVIVHRKRRIIGIVGKSYHGEKAFEENANFVARKFIERCRGDVVSSEAWLPGILNFRFIIVQNRQWWELVRGKGVWGNWENRFPGIRHMPSNKFEKNCSLMSLLAQKLHVKAPKIAFRTNATTAVTHAEALR